jgi:hypothetical protein
MMAMILTDEFVREIVNDRLAEAEAERLRQQLPAARSVGESWWLAALANRILRARRLAHALAKRSTSVPAIQRL